MKLSRDNVVMVVSLRTGVAEFATLIAVRNFTIEPLRPATMRLHYWQRRLDILVGNVPVQRSKLLYTFLLADGTYARYYHGTCEIQVVRA